MMTNIERLILKSLRSLMRATADTNHSAAHELDRLAGEIGKLIDREDAIADCRAAGIPPVTTPEELAASKRNSGFVCPTCGVGHLVRPG